MEAFMTENKKLIIAGNREIQNKIYRGNQVMIDIDFAMIIKWKREFSIKQSI